MNAVLEISLMDFAGDRFVEIWKRYPNITAEEDSQTDTYACEQVSRDLVSHLEFRGFAPVLVAGDDWEDHEDVWKHWWVEVDGEAIDFTARQFENVDGIDRDAVLAQPWPLRWDADEPHPILGIYKFRQTEES